MIEQNLSNTNEKCYSSQSQKISQTKQGLLLIEKSEMILGVLFVLPNNRMECYRRETSIYEINHKKSIFAHIIQLMLAFHTLTHKKNIRIAFARQPSQYVETGLQRLR